MPVYNGASFLEEAVASIRRQTFRSFELVAVDDGSTDRTPELLSQFASEDRRIRVITQPNGGIVSALNRGLAEATGEWLARMDADDIALPDRLERQFAAAGDDERLVVLGGDCVVIDQAGRPCGARRFPTVHRAILLALERGGAFLPHPTAFIRRAALERVGGYRERFRHAEDVDLWLRLSELGEIRSLPRVVLLLRKHASNVSSLAGGREQVRAGYAARIGHFRRLSGHSDPGSFDLQRWGEFLGWLDGKLERVYQQVAWVNALRKVRGGGGGLRAYWSLVDPVAPGAIARHLRRKMALDSVPRLLGADSVVRF